MISTGYLREKLSIALIHLAADTGSFEERLYNAYRSALVRLNCQGPLPRWASDLEWIIQTCQRHVLPSEGKMSSVGDLERVKIVGKLIDLFTRSSQRIAPCKHPRRPTKTCRSLLLMDSYTTRFRI